MPRRIPAYYALGLIDALNLPQHQIDDILKALDLPASRLNGGDGDGNIDVETFGRLFMALIKEAQRLIQPSQEAAQQIIDLSTYRLLFTYMLQAKDLQDAIARASAFFTRFHAQQQSFELKKNASQVSWNFQFPPCNSLNQLTFTEHFSLEQLHWLPGLTGRISALYFWHRLGSWLTGQYIDIDEVHIDLAVDGDASVYTHPFNAPVYFRQQDCKLSFNKRYLSLPIIRTEDDLNRMLSTFPAELMRIDETADSSASKVRGLLGEDYSRNMPTLDEVAIRLCTTNATLHRRLRAEGTSYQKIKDGCRRDSAIKLLRSHTMNGSCIAECLGFSDASTFYRAFKKWTGKTPQEFIQQEQNPPR